MPKRPSALPSGRMQWRDRFVERIREEQEQRNMPDAGLAKRVSEHYPMSPATVWKLKNAEPARGVSLDEAMAIAQAFGYSTVDEMLASSLAGEVFPRLERADSLLRESGRSSGEAWGEVLNLLHAIRLAVEARKTVDRSNAYLAQFRLDNLLVVLWSEQKATRERAEYLESLAGGLRDSLRERCPELPPSEFVRRGTDA